MRILLATDAWSPQVNGVVRTLSTTAEHLRRHGHDVRVVEPGLFPNFPCSFYPEIQLALPEPTRVDHLIDPFQPEAVHIATEGPVGFQVRRYCVRRRLRFSTSYHTRFPEYFRAYVCMPLSIGYRLLRWFHRRSASLMVSTATLAGELRSYGFRNRIVRWSRGVDTTLFRPRPRALPPEHRPVLMYVGRISREKNVEAFLSLRNPGMKYLVGDGPLRAELEARHPEAVFLGALSGERLAEAYANADVVVFPSKTDTFGLVILEALASGVPVAAYPVQGPADILRPPRTGCLDANLEVAVNSALRDGDPAACVALAREYSWEQTTEQFVGNLVPARRRRRWLQLGSRPTLRA